MPKRNTILIVDGHPSVRGGLRALFETDPDMEVVGDAHDDLTAIEAAYKLNPTIIILDMMVSSHNQLGIVRALRQSSPDSQILILTDYDGSDLVLDVVHEGARGYLLKDPLSANIASAIRNMLDGNLIIHRDIARSLSEENKLNPQRRASLMPEFVTFP